MRRGGAVAVALAACSSAAPAPATSTATSTATISSHTGSATLRAPAGAPPDPIGPAYAGAKACYGEADCSNGDRCFAPDFTPGRGVAPRCQQDQQCGSNEVCGGYDCMPRCGPATCGAGMRCAANGHCEELPCSDPAATPCPQNERCAASGACERIACRDASACDTGTCYQGRCFAHAGTCAPASYCCPP